MRTAGAERALAALLCGWGALAVASIWLRPLWPVDETRYASVAWEMWLRGDFLVPHVNGEPYSHKPPLLFWLIHAGWALFGVNDWWPRLIAPLAALAAVPLARRLSRRLWPDAREAQAGAPWVLFGTLLFAAFITLTLMDMLLALCVMAAMAGVLALAQGARREGVLWLGAGIGLGVLAKGPVVLLHVLPAALAAPWWARDLRGRMRPYYLALLGAVLLGAAIALAWAVPAAISGGEVYRRAIFWGQTAGRVAESFAHRAPWWYYAPLLPLVFFPWLVWPRLWRGLAALAPERDGQGLRFLAAWIVLTLLLFSLVSGKQAKYLLPLAPAFALLAAGALARPLAARRWEMLLPAAGFVVSAAVLGYLRARPAALSLPEWSAEVPLWPIVLLALLAPSLLLLSRSETVTQVRALACAMLAAAAVLGAGVVPAFVPYSDPGPAATYLASLQRRGAPVAHLGKYHAVYNFSGRLRAPIEILDPPELKGWVAAHPDGRVITVERSRHAGVPPGPQYEAPFRGAWVQVWGGAALLAARPELR